MTDDRPERLDHRDFRELALATLAERTGLALPDDPSPEEERAWREQAWRSYRLDIENRDELGTAAQATEPPPGDGTKH